MVRDVVNEYDRQFEQVVLKGWGSIKHQQITNPAFFNEPFRSYIADRFVADTFQINKPDATVQQLSQSFLDRSQAHLVDPVLPQQRKDLGICAHGRYCLGYNTLFKPVKPALTDLLLTIIAAQEPVTVAETAILNVEGVAPAAVSRSTCAMQPVRATRDRCEAIWDTLDIDNASPPPQATNCVKDDFQANLGSLLAGEPTVHLKCFSQEIYELMLSPGSYAADAPYEVGLIRAAIADFLFNYKMSQQYPHEFVPYDLSHSADALNNALNPLIDAFYRDIRSYQMFVRADMQYRVEKLNANTDGRCCVKRLFGLDKPSFFNDGLVTVRTIAGQPTTASATSQSFLNVSTAPELSTLLSSLAGQLATPAAAATPTSGYTISVTPNAPSAAPSPPAAVPGPNFATIAAALANYQSSFAQIGRQLSFAATARSLNTASSAEITVTLNADESAGGPLYTGPGASDPALNTSRVANHDTTTRVRVDSIKLFEVSSFSAIVERSRSRFPLLPPFVEIPYIGTFAGIPLGAAKEFHSSSAIISAYVVPTAADIAYGLRFVSDLVVDGLNPGPCSFFDGASSPDVTHACVFRKMFSLHDVGRPTIGEFNKNINYCFSIDTSVNGCSNVSFERTLAMHP
jgi:hypothetical protein